MAVLALLTLSAASAYAAYVETFEVDSASWNYGYGTGFVPGVTTWNSGGGNPNGHISGVSNNLYAVWTYDTTRYGDMTGLTLTVDTKVTDGETGNAQFYVGRGGTYFIDGMWPIGTDQNWTTQTVALDSSHFTSWTGVNDYVYTLAQVLQSPTDIGIFFGGGVASGSGSVLVDNFGTMVPEPSSIIVLLGGLGSLLARKLRRK